MELPLRLWDASRTNCNSESILGTSERCLRRANYWLHDRRQFRNVIGNHGEPMLDLSPSKPDVLGPPVLDPDELRVSRTPRARAINLHGPHGAATHSVGTAGNNREPRGVAHTRRWSLQAHVIDVDLPIRNERRYASDGSEVQPSRATPCCPLQDRSAGKPYASPISIFRPPYPPRS